VGAGGLTGRLVGVELVLGGLVAHVVLGSVTDGR
jgi:hypothetical protein